MNDPLLRVVLSDEEVLARAQELAQRLRDRDLLLEEHAEQRTKMKAELLELEKQIKRLADAVRLRSEDRTKQIGLFP
jgi:hypothetical protein